LFGRAKLKLMASGSLIWKYRSPHDASAGAVVVQPPFNGAAMERSTSDNVEKSPAPA